MKNMFSPDSWLMASLSRVTDLIILNLLLVLCSLPLVTVGAASAAAYTVLFRMGTLEEAGVVRPFFVAFWKNLKQGVVLWLLELALGGAVCFDVYLLFQMEGWAHYLYLPVLMLGLVGLMASGYVFPLISQFQNTIRQTIANSLLMGIAYLPRSVLMAVLNLLPVLLALLEPMIFFQLSISWVLLYFALAAYINTRLLKKVFAPFLEQQPEAPNSPTDSASPPLTSNV